MLIVMHRSRATSCTDSVHDHAPFFVQDRRSRHALIPCMLRGSIMHWNRATQDYIPTYVGMGSHLQAVGMGLQNPSCTACKTDVPSTASLRRQPLTYRTTNATTDRARGVEVSRHA